MDAAAPIRVPPASLDFPPFAGLRGRGRRARKRLLPCLATQIGVVPRKEPVGIGAVRSDSRYGGERLDKPLSVQENSRS